MPDTTSTTAAPAAVIPVEAAAPAAVAKPLADVSIRPHPCAEISDVQMVMLNGVQAGYCGAEPGRPLSLIARFRPEIVAAIQAHVEQATGGPVLRVVQPLAKSVVVAAIKAAKAGK